ncbi:MAG: hypothetical protein K8S99_05365 [Planctomycetes bacterium]|nr:hypothetical protein [Planctomycetota bacterium]
MTTSNKTPNLPDPVAIAAEQAKRINVDREQYLVGPLDRLILDSPWVTREELTAGLSAFHKERMAKVPPLAQYPESKPWVDHVLAVERELVRQAKLNDLEIALLRSLGDYTTFRGYVSARPRMIEKCRVAYLPETDRGEMHIKNVDDPSTFWKKSAPMKPSAWTEAPPLVWDGVGSGLHIDDEPEQIFPLPYNQMCFTYADDVPSAVDFLTRYSQFWGGQNIVLHDRKKRAVAIEKASRNHIEVFTDTKHGRAHCSGMACRNPKSTQGKYQLAKRDQYRTLFNVPDDGADQCFWAACDKAEKMLGDFIGQDRPIKADEVLKLFTTPFPKGLCKTGVKFHPEQGYGEFTLITHASVGTETERTNYRWERGDKPDLEWPTEPEVLVQRRG